VINCQERSVVKYSFCLFFSVVIIGVISEFYGDDWEQQVRRDLYWLKRSKVPAFSEECIDSTGIPYVLYSPLNNITAGKQYNPTIVCNYALLYYEEMVKGNQSYRQSFENCLGWLKKSISYHNNAAFYIFNWQQPWYDSVGIPFTSGMTSGLAIEVFTKGYQLRNDSLYLKLAKDLLRGFFIPIQLGGFSYQNKNGWWYEEIADTNMHTPFILDGHIFSLTGVHYYLAVTKDDSASAVFANGIAALKYLLPSYDKGDGWAYYDKYMKTADKHYQHVLSGQMKQLFNITEDSLFLNYHKKWNKPFSQPYIVRIAKEGNASGILLVCVLLLPFVGLTFILIRQKLI